MNTQQLIRDFRKRAAMTGERITLENRSKCVVVRCGDRRVLLPHTKRPLQHPRRFYKALVL